MKKITVLILAVLAAAIIVGVITSNCKNENIQNSKNEIIDAAIEEADRLVDNAGKPTTVKGEIPVSCLEKKYPETFDLRSVDTDGDGIKENYVTGVKYQTPFGTCWSFSSISAAETSILYDLKQDAVTTDENGNPTDSINLSEHHLAWFAYSPMPEGDVQAGEGLYSQIGDLDKYPAKRLNSGSSQFSAGSIFASGTGPVQEPDFYTAEEPESQLSYHGKNMLTEYDEQKGYSSYSEKDDWSIDESQRFRQSYMLENVYYLPIPVCFDENGKFDVDYADTVVKAYKEQLMNGRAVSVAYCSDNYMPYKTEAVAKYINNDTWAHYCYDQPRANHAVTIVGWDDNYSRENFLTEVQATYDGGKPVYDENGNPVMKQVGIPEKDGAWIVKNSWGSLDSISDGLVENNWGINGSGYFYLSYYDHSIEMADCFDFDVENRLKENLGKYVLQEYDMMPCEVPHCISMDFPVAEANVFTAEENETLKAISCTTTLPDEEVTFGIYLMNPSLGQVKITKIFHEFTKTFASPGLHVVQLPEFISVEKGDRIAVCMSQKSDNKYLLGVGMEYNQKGFDAGYCDDSYAANAVVNPGESYIFLSDSNVWTDFSEIKNILENLDGSTSYFSYDNFPIKLYASIDE